MLAIQQKQEASEALRVNLLPFKVNYDGPVEVERKYWRPEQTEEGKRRAYFRGRDLEGNVVKIPEGYQGSILRITDKVIPAKRPAAPQDDEEDDEDQNVEETKAIEELGTFDEVMVWNHDVPWDAAEEPYVKGVDEWMSFAKAIHSCTEADEGTESSTRPS